MNEPLRPDWPARLRPLVNLCHPPHPEITRPIERDCYWPAAESEYATDVMFRDPAALERIYPALIHHSVMHLGSEQVLRFMGRPVGVHRQDEVQSDRRRGPDGVRVKHWLNTNSQKLYDKGSVLCSETTINQPKDFRLARVRRQPGRPETMAHPAAECGGFASPGPGPGGTAVGVAAGSWLDS